MNVRKLTLPASIAGAVFLGAAGGSLVSSLASNAATTSTTSGSSTSASSTAAPNSMPAHGSAAHEDSEAAVTGDNATKAQAAAVKSLGGGTAGAVTSDYTHSGYEVTVTKSDGTSQEVHLDSSFNVMTGGPGGGQQ